MTRSGEGSPVRKLTRERSVEPCSTAARICVPPRSTPTTNGRLCESVDQLPGPVPTFSALMSLFSTKCLPSHMRDTYRNIERDPHPYSPPTLARRSVQNVL